MEVYKYGVEYCGVTKVGTEDEYWQHISWKSNDLDKLGTDVAFLNKRNYDYCYRIKRLQPES